MSDFDAIITNLFASKNSLKQAIDLAEKADVPTKDVEALEAALATLDAQIDRMHSLAMTRGAPERFNAVRKLELKDDD